MRNQAIKIDTEDRNGVRFDLAEFRNSHGHPERRQVLHCADRRELDQMHGKIGRRPRIARDQP